MKHKRKISISITIILVLIIGYFISLSIVFPYKTKYGAFTIYSDSQVSDSIYKILDCVERNIAKHEFYDSSVNYNIYLCSNYNQFSFYNPFFKNASAIANPLNIFVTKSDIDKDVVIRNGTEYITRTLTGVLSHEISHQLIFNEIGFWESMRKPTWKIEGYCDFIANESSFPIEMGNSLIGQKKISLSPSFFYFTARISIEYLLKNNEITFAEILSSDIEQDKIISKIQESGYKLESTK